jgi:hypothetical protein
MRTTRGPKSATRLIFIVNGEDVPVFVGETERMETGRDKALAKSHNTGRPATEWEIRDERGVMLPSEPKIGSFGFMDGTRLFLTLKVGVGGIRGADRIRERAVATMGVGVVAT